MIDIAEVQNNIEAKAESLGIDLTAYGQASPTKLILSGIEFATNAMQTAALVAITEQNPLAATTLKSKLGLAYLTGLNPVSLMEASSGYVMVYTNGYKLTISQNSKLISSSNVEYYVVLPTETVLLNDNTELLVCQGTLKTVSAIATTENWQTITLQAGGIVPYASVSAMYNGLPMTIGLSIESKTDAFLAISDTGETVLIVNKTFERIVGNSFTVSYSDCIGSYGDNSVVGTTFSGSNFAFSGGEDVTNNITIKISAPIIGGTNFNVLTEDLGIQLMLSSKTNLIGTEAQVLQYIKRFSQYIIQSSSLTNGVLTLAVLRNTATLMQTMDYWTAIKQLTIDNADIKSLMLHVNSLANKSLDLLVNITTATIEYCDVIINANMTIADSSALAQTLVTYAISELYSRNYETGKLYSALIANTNVKEVTCSFVGNTNSFGTAIPTNSSAILVIKSASITVNGQTIVYE